MGDHPIGVFDSGYGGLTVLKELVKSLPEYDYLYLGDNARAPYGSRSFDTVHEYTLEACKWFFEQGCPLVILACNTASAKALRSIQQNDLELIGKERRILGVIRPSTEVIGNYTKNGSIGILATTGTVTSNSYVIEINKFFPEIKVHQEACPIWVPLIENYQHNTEAANFFIKQHIDNLLQKSPDIDTILLACTHYPLMYDKIREITPANITIISQGLIVAESLKDYLIRHPGIEKGLSKNSKLSFCTTDSPEEFNRQSLMFFGQEINSIQVHL